MLAMKNCHQHFDSDLIFSSDPYVRWKCAQSVLRERPDSVHVHLRQQSWPRYWWGSLNAWLLFLGPSPGNSAAKPIDWEVEGYPSLGEPHIHFLTQQDSSGFWERMRQWVTNAFTLAGVFENDLDAAIGSSLLGNVLSIRQGDAGKIDKSALEHAISRVVSILARIRPRVVVPIHKTVSKLLIQEIERSGGEIVDGPSPTNVMAVAQRYEYYKPNSWSINMPFGKLLVAESPQHPSKHNFYDSHQVDLYLAEKIRSCLPHG